MNKKQSDLTKVTLEVSAILREVSKEMKNTLGKSPGYMKIRKREVK